MCGICGCNELNHEHHHGHDHQHPKTTDTVQIEQDILSQNQQFSLQNKDFFEKHKILALNLMSSPGAGKTTLLTKTLTELKTKYPFQVITGDLQTDRDAQRISSSGVSAIQINTGKGCHLDAHSLQHTLTGLSHQSSILFIENVGNLVCPALFDLGETYKIVLLSITEGADKPLKYPHIFHAADLVILTKIDLSPYVEFDIDECQTWIKQINPQADILTISTTTGENMISWYDWLGKKWQNEFICKSMDAFRA